MKSLFEDGLGLFGLIITFSTVFGIAGITAYISSFFIVRK